MLPDRTFGAGFTALFRVCVVVGVVVVLELLCPSVAGDCVLYAPLDDILFEQHVDGFQGNVLRLGYTHNGVEAHENTAHSEKKKGSIRDLIHHDRGNLGCGL